MNKSLIGLKIKQLRSDYSLKIGKKVTQKDLSEKIGISRSYLGDIESGRINPSTEILKKIANALNVSIDDFFGDSLTESVECPECGLHYCPDIREEYQEHENIHKAWKRAIKKFGFCYKFREREQLKKTSRTILSDNTSTKSQKYNAAIDFFKAYFSRSLEASNFNINHVSFKDFVSMLLNNNFGKDDIPVEIYNELIKKYGKKIGIEKESSYYNVLNTNTQNNLKQNDKCSKKIDTIAAHLEGKNITPQKMKLLEKYIDALFEEDD